MMIRNGFKRLSYFPLRTIVYTSHEVYPKSASLASGMGHRAWVSQNVQNSAPMTCRTPPCRRPDGPALVRSRPYLGFGRPAPPAASGGTLPYAEEPCRARRYSARHDGTLSCLAEPRRARRSPVTCSPLVAISGLPAKNESVWQGRPPSPAKSQDATWPFPDDLGKTGGEPLPTIAKPLLFWHKGAFYATARWAQGRPRPRREAPRLGPQRLSWSADHAGLREQAPARHLGGLRQAHELEQRGRDVAERAEPTVERAPRFAKSTSASGTGAVV